MAPFEGSPSPNQGEFGSDTTRKDSNAWTTAKSSLVLGLKATQMTLDGLPIPGVKGCVSLILHLMETVDLATGNAEALEALQRRLESLQEVLSPLHTNKALDIPDDVRNDIWNLAVNLDKIALQWKHKLDKENKKRIRRLITAEDDQDLLTLSLFANAVEQTILAFLVVTTANRRITAFREDIKNREARTLQLLPRASAASYKPIRTGGANPCLKGTRISVLRPIKEWATNPDPNQPPMFWLNGLAGIGKATIAHTIASELDAEGLLGANFVFLRTNDQLKDARLVFPTLAFQLAQFNPYFRTGLVEVLEQDPDCGSNPLDLQFEYLILKPFSTMSLSAPIVIILNALDECESEELTSELLRILRQKIQSVPFLRVFITSRPEGYIREALDLVNNTSPHKKLDLHEDIYTGDAENDIRLFLRMRLQSIWDERTNRPSVRWPAEEDLEKLVEQSGKLFVYAATAVRFVGGRLALNLNRQLSTLLNIKIGHVPIGEPYRQLDALYLQILDTVFIERNDNYYVHRLRRIVGTIVFLERPLPLRSLAKLLGDYSVEEMTETLYHLHSIIIVPETDVEAPRPYHLSFPNFITNSDRCTNPIAHIDPSQLAKYLFVRCLAVLQEDLGPVLVKSTDDEIGIQSTLQPQDASFAEQKEEPLTDVDTRSVRFYVPLEDVAEDYGLAPELRYSDNYWCRHLMNIPTGDQEAADALERFVIQFLPHWLLRRTSRIMHNVRGFNVRLARDTFDIMHDVYHWGSHSGCSKQLQVFLRQSAKHLYAALFPDADVEYSFGRRLDPDVLFLRVNLKSSSSSALLPVPLPPLSNVSEPSLDLPTPALGFLTIPSRPIIQSVRARFVSP